MKHSILFSALGISLILVLTFFTTNCISIPDNLTDLIPGDATKQLDEETIIAGLKEALEIGTGNAVNIVSKTNGFLENPDIYIPLPDELEDFANVLKKVGMKKKMDTFIEDMNHAAEKAAEGAADIFIDAIGNMTLSDARNILQGPDNAATSYFEQNTRDDLYDIFIPVVENAMNRIGLTKLYKTLQDAYNKVPLVKKVHFDLNQYITDKGLDGLFHMLAKEEKKIRDDPAARVTELLKEVFGSL